MGFPVSERKQYIVTERAGAWVAGRRRPADGRLWLTEREAAYELALGTIRPYVEKAPTKAKRRRKRKTD